MATLEKFCAPGMFDPLTYSQGIKVSQAQTILFLSGQVAYTGQGGTMANIVKITTYVTDMRYRVDLAPVREEFFGKKGPASTLVEISALAHPDWMIEIEAIAVI